MINAVIIDDEVHCIDTLSILLHDYCPEVVVKDRCVNAKSGLSSIEKYSPDLVFLDIEMPVTNGFELLEKVGQISFAVIFTTGYDQYAIKAIRFSALDYLLKPIDPEELVEAVQRVISQKHLPAFDQYRLLLDKLNKNENGLSRIAIPTSEGFELILAAQVIRCEADNNYTHLYLKDKRCITACRTLKELEEQMQDFPFFLRVHNSYVANLNEVNRYIRVMVEDFETVSIKTV